MNSGTTQENPAIAQTKQLRKELDQVLKNLRRDSEKNYNGFRAPDHFIRGSRERSLAVTKIQEAIMWLGMDLKDIGAPNPYPHSYDPTSQVIDPTADGLKLQIDSRFFPKLPPDQGQAVSVL